MVKLTVLNCFAFAAMVCCEGAFFFKGGFMKTMSCRLLVHALSVVLFAGFTAPAFSETTDQVESVVEQLELDDQIEPMADVLNRNMMCQRYNYDYRRCVAAGCLFDGGSGACYGQMHPQPGPQPLPPPHHRPNYCQQFNYNQFQCNQAGCYFDHRTGVCFDGGQYPPPPAGYRVMCIAVDAGYEEHPRGHVGIGRGRYQAEQAALGDCMRYHGRCRIRECRYQ
jgi:hypothetical protein